MLANAHGHFYFDHCDTIMIPVSVSFFKMKISRRPSVDWNKLLHGVYSSNPNPIHRT